MIIIIKTRIHLFRIILLIDFLEIPFKKSNEKLKPQLNFKMHWPLFTMFYTILKYYKNVLLIHTVNQSLHLGFLFKVIYWRLQSETATLFSVGIISFRWCCWLVMIQRFTYVASISVMYTRKTDLSILKTSRGVKEMLKSIIIQGHYIIYKFAK